MLFKKIKHLLIYKPDSIGAKAHFFSLLAHQQYYFFIKCILYLNKKCVFLCVFIVNDKINCAMCSDAQSCSTLCNPMDSSSPGSSVHGILQERILEWVIISSSRGSSRLRDGACVSYISCTGKQILYYQCHMWKLIELEALLYKKRRTKIKFLFRTGEQFLKDIVIIYKI